jgi:NitT/TauT family transport system substrate-binding protein
MLAESKVDAITGFSFSMFLNLVRLGVPEDDITIMLMANNGLELYGNSIIVNTDFAEKNSELVTGFLRAVAKGWKAAIENPEDAVKSMIKRNPAADLALETRRLKLAIEGNVLTANTASSGMGNIDEGRMKKAISQLAENYKFENSPNMSLYFTDQYLPSDGSLMIK